MPTSKVIRPAVFDETGEHVIPADADLNLDPVSSDPDNYIVRGSDGGAFLNGDGVLSNNGENLLKTDSADGKVTYSRSDAVSLINETVKPSIDKLEKKHDEDVDALQRSDARLQTGIDKVQGAADKAQAAADKAQASADKAAESARKADEDAAAAQCTATQALNDAADAKTAADRAQARADAAYDKASDAQCAAADALDKAQEAVDSLPEIADAHSSIVTAGDGIKVAQSKLGDHNVYQVGVKANGDDSGLISSSDGLEVELKGNGGLDKDRDGLYVDKQWLDEIVARYSKEHMLFNQFKVVSSLPAVADVHTIYLIRNKDSSAADVGAKDSFEGWVIVSTENGTQKGEKIGYKTDLTGYTHTGNTVKLTGDTSGTGTVDANGNVVVQTAVSHATNAGHATNADSATNAGHATNADHAASADKTTGGTVRITGYVSGTGSFDRNGNVTVDVVADIRDTPYTYYVGKTNARDYWGKDENGNQWGSTKDHPFASLTYAINQSNSHIFPGNTINIIVLDAGEYVEGDFRIWHVTCNTNVRVVPAEHPRFRGSYEIKLSNSAELYFFSCDFYQWNITSEDQDINGVTFIRVYGDGVLAFRRSCHMIMDSSNFGKNGHSMLQLHGNTTARFDIENAEPALYMELRNGAACPTGIFRFGSLANIESYTADSVAPANIVINAPAGTKFSGSSVYVERAGNVSAGQSGNYVTGTKRHTFRIDWNIADDSALTQVDLDKYSYLNLPANSVKGQKLPGHAVGTIRDGADYEP